MAAPQRSSRSRSRVSSQRGVVEWPRRSVCVGLVLGSSHSAVSLSGRAAAFESVSFSDLLSMTSLGFCRRAKMLVSLVRHPFVLLLFVFCADVCVVAAACFSDVGCAGVNEPDVDLPHVRRLRKK